MKGTDFDRHPDDDAFRAFMADVDRILFRAAITLALLAALGLAGAAVLTP